MMMVVSRRRDAWEGPEAWTLGCEGGRRSCNGTQHLPRSFPPSFVRFVLSISPTFASVAFWEGPRRSDLALDSYSG